jgi:hypothetical protein
MTQAQPEQFLPRKERIPKDAKVKDENGSQINRVSSSPLGFENFLEDVRRWVRLYGMRR